MSVQYVFFVLGQKCCRHLCLYVYDSNNKCVQVLTADGMYLGAALLNEEVGEGKPCRLRWCTTSSCLIFTCMKKGRYHISKIHDKDQTTTQKEGPNTPMTMINVLGSGIINKRKSTDTPAKRIAIECPVAEKRPSGDSSANNQSSAAPQSKKKQDTFPYQCQGMYCGSACIQNEYKNKLNVRNRIHQ